MTAISSTSIEANNKSYIKEYSWSGFKLGIKYSSYLYLGATVASLFISLAVVPIFPFTLLISNPVAWAVLGVVFIVLSGIVMSIVKPLFHLTRDFINERKIQKKKEETISSDATLSDSELQVDTDKSNSTSRRSSIDSSDSDVSEEEDFVHMTLNEDESSWLHLKDMSLETNRVYSNFAEKTNQRDYTCWLDNYDICHIAYTAYKYLPRSINDDVYFLFSQLGNECFNQELKDYGEVVKKNPGLIFTSIISTGCHFVTLVVAYNKEDAKFRAYYCDSFGSELPSKMPKVIKKELKIEEKNIKSCKTKQQKDGYNCAIFALENAKKITDMMREGRSLDKIDGELAKYQPSEKELQNKRIEFAKAIEEDHKRNMNGKKDPPLSYIYVPREDLYGEGWTRGCYL